MLRFAPEAATEAARVGAHREACVHLGRALEHADLLDPVEHAHLLSRAADAHDHVGDTGSALALSERSMALFRQCDDSEALAARTAQHAMLLWSAARTADARRCADEAVSVGERVPGSRGQAAAWTSDAYLRMLARDADGAILVGERAISLARYLADQYLLARALTAVGSARFIAGQPEAGTESLLEALAIARAAQDDERVGSAMVNLGSSAGECRRYELAEHWLRACEDWCGQRDLMPNLAYARAWLSRVAFERGDWDTAAELAGGEVDGEVISSIVSLTVLGRLAARRGEAQAGDTLASAWALAQQTEDLQRLWPAAAARAEAAYLAGQEGQVAEIVRDTFDRAVELRHSWAVGELGYWLWRAGSLTSEQRAQTVEWGAPAYAAQARGEPEATSLEWDRLGCPYEAAVARSESDDPTTVADSIRTFDRLRAVPMADLAAARLRDLGGHRPPRPRGTTATNPGGLTDRELAVLELVGDGLTNAEIAERMRISTKTAGHHVSSILAKLGVPSRREASRVAEGWRR